MFFNLHLDLDFPVKEDFPYGKDNMSGGDIARHHLTFPKQIVSSEEIRRLLEFNLKSTK